MAIQPIRRGAVGRSTYKASGDRPNGSQYRPTSPGSKRASQPIAAPAPTEGTDRFAIHAYGNTKITINGADFSVLTEYDPDYILPMYNPYLLAQKGVYIRVASLDIVDEIWMNEYNPSIGSGMIISDYYETDSEVPNAEASIKGIPLEIYSINITGPSVAVGIVALDNPPIDGALPAPRLQLMSLTVDAPLGVSAHQKFYDQSPLMISSDQYVTVNPPVLGTCVLTPKLARKSSGLRYLPAILKPPVRNDLQERDEHTVAIVIGFNGGTPKLFKYSFGSNYQSQGDTGDSGSDWSYAISEIRYSINEIFNQEVRDYLNLETTLPNDMPITANLFSESGTGLFFIGGSSDSSSNSMFLLSLTISGYNEIYDKEEDGCYPLTKPAYITVYPNHALIKADPSITIDLGVESTFNQNSSLVPFNVHTNVIEISPMAE